MIKEIVKKGDLRLKKVSAEVDTKTKGVMEVAKDLTDTLVATNNAVALSAPQIGVNLRMFVVNFSYGKKDAKPDILVVINPHLTSKSGFDLAEEGCLSIPNFRVNKKRCDKVKLHGYTIVGNKFTLVGVGVWARCFQHEIDHLNGKLIDDVE